MTLLLTLEDSFLQVTHRCRLDRIGLDSWIQTFLTIRAHHKQAGTNSENPGLEAKWILEYTVFLTWKECAASGCRCFISEHKWEQISLTRNRSLFSLVPSRYSRHLCCHFTFAVFPTSAVAAVWMRPTAHSSGRTLCAWSWSWCLHSGFSFTGSVNSTATTCLALGTGVLLQYMASIRHYRCRSYTFRHGTWGIWQTWGLSIKAFFLLSSIWSKKICSSYNIRVSVPYSFHMQNFSAVYHYQTNCQGNLLVGVWEGGTESCLSFERSLKRWKWSSGTSYQMK